MSGVVLPVLVDTSRLPVAMRELDQFAKDSAKAIDRMAAGGSDAFKKLMKDYKDLATSQQVMAAKLRHEHKGFNKELEREIQALRVWNETAKMGPKIAADHAIALNRVTVELKAIKQGQREELATLREQKRLRDSMAQAKAQLNPKNATARQDLANLKEEIRLQTQLETLFAQANGRNAAYLKQIKDMTIAANARNAASRVEIEMEKSLAEARARSVQLNTSAGKLKDLADLAESNRLKTEALSLQARLNYMASSAAHVVKQLTMEVNKQTAAERVEIQTAKELHDVQARLKSLNSGDGRKLAILKAEEQGTKQLVIAERELLNKQAELKQQLDPLIT
ncbi:MAG: hypothetical protein EOM24_36700, partial [Chloroflexia bacterium]|nr:hypothetical protein [Chloroflexia bacterium]